MVSHDALFAALKSELIRAYVDAVMVPSNPDKKALIHKADGCGVSKLAKLRGVVASLRVPYVRNCGVTYRSLSTKTASDAPNAHRIRRLPQER